MNLIADVQKELLKYCKRERKAGFLKQKILKELSEWQENPDYEIKRTKLPRKLKKKHKKQGIIDYTIIYREVPETSNITVHL